MPDFFRVERMSMAEKKEKIDFEKAMESLEKTVAALEGGELTLDQALKKYEEGVGLVRACQSQLTEAEKKIEVLTRALDGSFKKEPFDACGKPAAKVRKKGLVRGENSSDEED
jgi:exodeoxyribonuclease VII small subunit